MRMLPAEAIDDERRSGGKAIGHYVAMAMDRPTPTRPRPFRFGVQLAGLRDARDWTEQARRAEALGYDIVTMPDHVAAAGMVGPQLAPLTGLQAVLDATTTLRAGALVLANDYRHPAILAKELATMDVLSDGRVEIGLGAGWMTDDYQRLGIPLDRPSTRIERLAEAFDVIDGCFAPGPFTYAGTHYRIDDYDALPLPVQSPRPPILVGGGGPRLLTLAAHRADIVGINATLGDGAFGPAALDTMTADAVDTKLGIVRDAAGDRLDEVELHLRAFFVSVTSDRRRQLGELSETIGVPAELIDASPYALIGTVAEICEQLLDRRERLGFSYVTFSAAEMDLLAPVVTELAGR